MRAAIVEGGTVANVILLADDADPAAFHAVPCPDEAQIGWGYASGKFAPPAPPEWDTAPPVPASVLDYQFAWQAAAERIITRDEALAWSGRGEVPASLKAAVDKLVTDPDQHFGVMMLLVGAKSYERANPYVQLLGTLFGKDAAGLDQFWRDAVQRGVAAVA